METSHLEIQLKIGVLLIFLSANVFAHKNRPHAETPAPTKPEKSSSSNEDRLAQINEAYKLTVKPIFQKKCFDCHGQISSFPWYYNLPGIKQLIDSDLKEAKEHLDFTNDFPFKGHGTTTGDLETIRDSINDSSMPPFLYLITHRASHISDAEKRVILDWLEESTKALKKD